MSRNERVEIAEDVRKYAAEQGLAEEEALQTGMEKKTREFNKAGRRFTRSVNSLTSRGALLLQPS